MVTGASRLPRPGCAGGNGTAASSSLAGSACTAAALATGLADAAELVGAAAGTGGGVLGLPHARAGSARRTRARRRFIGNGWIRQKPPDRDLRPPFSQGPGLPPRRASRSKSRTAGRRRRGRRSARGRSWPPSCARGTRWSRGDAHVLARRAKSGGDAPVGHLLDGQRLAPTVTLIRTGSTRNRKARRRGRRARPARSHRPLTAICLAAAAADVRRPAAAAGLRGRARAALDERPAAVGHGAAVDAEPGAGQRHAGRGSADAGRAAAAAGLPGGAGAALDAGCRSRRRQGRTGCSAGRSSRGVQAWRAARRRGCRRRRRSGRRGRCRTGGASPQPSPAGPHWMPSWAQVLGVQVGAPHTLGVPPPPQVWPEGQMPQASVPPQPSPAGPQLDAQRGAGLGRAGGRVAASRTSSRSKIMNSSSFSCAVMGRAAHSVGKSHALGVADVLDVEVVEEHAPALLRGGHADGRVERVVHVGAGEVHVVDGHPRLRGRDGPVLVVAQHLERDLPQRRRGARRPRSHSARSCPLGKVWSMYPVWSAGEGCCSTCHAAVPAEGRVVEEPHVAEVGGEDAPAGVGVVDHVLLLGRGAGGRLVRLAGEEHHVVLVQRRPACPRAGPRWARRAATAPPAAVLTGSVRPS